MCALPSRTVQCSCTSGVCLISPLSVFWPVHTDTAMHAAALQLLANSLARKGEWGCRTGARCLGVAQTLRAQNGFSGAPAQMLAEWLSTMLTSELCSAESGTAKAALWLDL